MDTAKRIFASFVEVLEIAFVAVMAVFIIRNFLVQPFLVNGASMEPNFSNSDYLLVDELVYRFRDPRRGEVIVFRYPGDESTFYIKRIIGLPYERVVLKDGVIKIFGDESNEKLELEEPYLAPGLLTRGENDVILGADEYFVFGDNRSYSFDSRSWGPLPAKDLIGLVRVRLWPLNNISMFEAPTY
ncbi:MAG: signal peptidase I [Candidatus Liptonbacteria bacterium]|nr:signal peptidase I [Candidatus Liptonbacteria bacterium]